jgi:uncharacterized membrane protein
MLKEILTLFVLVIAIDMIWLLLIMKTYMQEIKKIQKEDVSINFISAYITYLLIPIGLYYLAIKDTTNVKDRVTKAFIFGITAYGIYDFTNGALFKDWNMQLAVADTIWGGILCASSVYVYSHYF